MCTRARRRMPRLQGATIYAFQNNAGVELLLCFLSSNYDSGMHTCCYGACRRNSRVDEYLSRTSCRNWLR